MSKARALPTGLGLETEGLELPLDQLPPWTEDKVKTFPALWKNTGTGGLHLQIHPSAISSLIIAPLPEGSSKEGALYPDGATISDLGEVRKIVYGLQRPAIRPELVYPHDWDEGDLVLFHNRGVLHSVVGAFTVSSRVRTLESIGSQ